MTTRRHFAALLATLACGSTAFAQPDNPPLSFQVPFAPGGGSDIVARQMSTRMGQVLQRPVVIENRAGANGAIGAAYVARSRADGNTILIGSVGTFVISPLLVKSTPFQTARDFDLLTIAVRTPNVITVNAALPVNSLAELIAYMKKNEGKVSFASAGNGSTEHLSAVLMWKQAGADGIHVPYKGAGAAVADLLAGHVDVLISNVGILAPHIKSGKVKALAVTADARSPVLPAVPAVVESGHKELVVYSWQGIVGPKGMPQAASARLQESLLATLRDPDVKKNLEAAGFEVVGSSAGDFDKYLASETSRWKRVIDGARITVE